MKLKVGDGATQHCVCPKFIMLTIFRGPSGEGGPPNRDERGGVSGNIIGVCASVMRPFSLFLCRGFGDKIEVCLAICHRRWFDEAAQNFKSDPGEIS